MELISFFGTEHWQRRIKRIMVKSIYFVWFCLWYAKILRIENNIHFPSFHLMAYFMNTCSSSPSPIPFIFWLFRTIHIKDYFITKKEKYLISKIVKEWKLIEENGKVESTRDCERVDSSKTKVISNWPIILAIHLHAVLMFCDKRTRLWHMDRACEERGERKRQGNNIENQFCFDSHDIDIRCVLLATHLVFVFISQTIYQKYLDERLCHVTATR